MTGEAPNDWNFFISLALFGAAAMSAVAAFASVYVAVISPRRAAEENSRREEQAERRRLKVWVFGTIMQDRPRLNGRDAVRALNLIDALYHDVREVRDSWARLHHALSTGRDWDQAKDIEVRSRTNELLAAMAQHLGLADDMRADDFARVYFPANLADQEDLETLQRRAAIQHFSQLLHPPGPEPDSEPAVPPKPKE